MQSWAEPLRSAALRGRRGRLGFSSKLQTARHGHPAGAPGAVSFAPSAGYVPHRRDEAVSVAAKARLAAAAGGRREGRWAGLTAGRAPPWSSPTGAPPARISSRTLCRDAHARALAPARSRARALARACLHLITHLELSDHAPVLSSSPSIYRTRCRADAVNSVKTQT